MGNCEDCKWFDKEDNMTGYCHRYPPQRDKSGNNIFKSEYYPYILNTGWCGEFSAKIDSILLPIDEFNSRVKRFLRVRKKDGQPIDTISQFLALSKAEILNYRTIGEVTYYDILDIQKQLKGIKANWREEKAHAAAREALGIE